MVSLLSTPQLLEAVLAHLLRCLPLLPRNRLIAAVPAKHKSTVSAVMPTSDQIERSGASIAIRSRCVCLPLNLVVRLFRGGRWCRRSVALRGCGLRNQLLLLLLGNSVCTAIAAHVTPLHLHGVLKRADGTSPHPPADLLLLLLVVLLLL